MLNVVYLPLGDNDKKLGLSKIGNSFFFNHLINNSSLNNQILINVNEIRDILFKLVRYAVLFCI